ncbi:MAG TPA: PaaI family thioesterase [bacterium]|nr:PaaI family thioesterase [bacterium]
MPAEPLNPHYEQAVRRMFAGQPLMAFLGAELTLVTPGACEMALAYRPELTQHHGYFHGGIIATLADNVGGAAGYSLLAEGMGAVTVEIKINLLAPGIGQRLVARGQVVRAGKTLVVCRSDVYAVQDGQETPCATCLMTLMVVPTATR